MFNSVTDAKTFLLNHGMIDVVDLQLVDVIADDLYRHAETPEQADDIVQTYVK